MHEQPLSNDDHPTRPQPTAPLFETLCATRVWRCTVVPQALTIFFMSTSDALEQIIMAQGRTKAVAIATTVASW